jgi:crotonobetainyl-CoA:carnitine CoA-transferase CaiB-like acyl-CoA transferase
MEILGFLPILKERGADDLGLALVSDEKKDLILATLGELIATDSRDKWLELLRAADIISAPVNTLLEASNDPDVLANGYIAEVEYPEIGETLKVHGSPWQFSETPAKLGVAPKLGEHNNEILSGIGYSKVEIAALQEQKVI